MKIAVTIVATLAACGDLTARWDLAHDRIIAVRSTPPHVATGIAVIDALTTTVEGGPEVESPTTMSATGLLASTISHDDRGWIVTAPDAALLDQARAEQGLAAGVPVPLVLDLTFGTLKAQKTMWFGDALDNPALGAVTVDGVAPTAELTVPYDTDIPLEIVEDPAWTVRWLTSCGSLRDDDEHGATLHVELGDPTSGALVVVVRDEAGGVVWGQWPIQSNRTR